METNTMTDSELLALARDYTDKAIRNDDWLKFDLARFVADYLDDGPVTEEVLEQIAADSDGLLEMRNGQMWIVDWSYYFEVTPSRGVCELLDDDDGKSICDIESISQLRHLLRGLGVGV